MIRIGIRFIGASLLAVLTLAPAEAPAQDGVWAGHTSMRRINAIDASDTHVWSASDGGVFSYAIDSGEIKTFTAVDGLHNVDVRTLAVDRARGYVWAGYGSGVLDRIDVEEGTITRFRDIERAGQYASRGINRILVRGDSLLIATQFGIVVFDPVRSEVRDSYTRLGDSPAATEVFDVLVAPDETGATTIWAGGTTGVARAPLTSPNLQDPSAWTVERSGLTGESETVRSLAFFDGLIYAGTEADLFRRAASGLYEPLSLTSLPVTELRTIGTQLYGVERFRVLVLEPGAHGLVSVNGYQDPVSVAGSPTGGAFLGDGVLGLAGIPSISPGSGAVDIQFSVIPAGPYDGLFSDLLVDDEGNLWAGGVDGAGTGIYMLSENGIWTTYASIFNPELQGMNSFNRLAADPSGTLWATSAGSGLVRIESDGAISVFNHTNSSLRPATGFESFILPGGVAVEEDGTLWATTRASSLPLHVRTPDGEWLGFGPYIGAGLTARSTAYDRVFVDSFDQKWIVVIDENNFQLSRGLLVADTGSPLNVEDDAFRFFGEDGSAGQGLPSRAVRNVTEDRDGLVWIGTESGPAYFVNSGVVASDPSARAIWPQWADRSQGTFMLFGLSINGIAVDPANQLWFATDDGAWLVRPVEGGYETVHHFTTENSPLFSDEVLDVAVNGHTGEVFLSTSLGLLSFRGDAVTPSAMVRDLFVYPNPVHMTGGATPDIYIDGLVEETDIRILTSAGSLVRRLSARGGRAKWDGRDESGSLVSSGVYLVVAVGADGGGAAHGKVAVIR